MNKILFTIIALCLQISLGCSPQALDTTISEKEQKAGVYAKSIITINGFSYLETSKSYSKIRERSYAKSNNGEEIYFSTYSSDLKVQIKDMNQNGKHDLLITSKPFLSNYVISEIVLANQQGELDFNQNYSFNGFYKMNGKSFGYVGKENTCNAPSISEFILCEWTDEGYVERQYCYYNIEKKDCLCFSKPLDDCETLEEFQQKQKNGTSIAIKGDLKKAIEFWDFY